MQALEMSQLTRQAGGIESEAPIVDAPTDQCIILDFCEQGLFLRIKQPTDYGFRKGTRVNVYFSATVDSKKEYFQIESQIDRVTENGIGLKFDSISEPMFDALRHSDNIGSVAAHSSNPAFYLTSSNQTQFNLAFKYMLNKNLVKLMSHFFNYAEDELDKPLQHARSFKDVSAYDNLAFALRMNKNKLTAAFCRAVTTDITFTGDTYPQQDEHGILADNLSLLDLADYEGNATYKTLVSTINSGYKKQLIHLETKLSYVVCLPCALIKNPISPDLLCDYFRKEVAGIDESVTVKIILYKAFQTTLSNHLSELYNAFDTLMVEHGAPSKLPQKIVWKKNFPAQLKSQPNPNLPEDFLVTQQLPTFDNDIYYFSEAYNVNTPNIQKPRALQQPFSQTIDNLFELFNQNLTPYKSIPTGLGYRSNDIGKLGHPENFAYSTDELFTAINRLQVSKAVQQLSQYSASLLETALIEALSPSGHLGPKTLSSKDSAKLELYNQLFQALSNELAITPSVKSYVERIKLPLMALTLTDPDFLNSNTHPASNLLNQLSSLESAINHNKSIKNTKIKQVLDNLVSRINQSFVNNPEIFSITNEALKEFSIPVVKSKESSVRRVIDIYEGKQRFEKAKQKIQRDIDNRIAGKTIASVIPLLLDSGWQHLLVLTELNANTADQGRYFEVLDNLLVWHSRFEQKLAVRNDLVELELGFINNKLGTICTNAFLQSKIIAELRATLISIGSSQFQQPIDKILVEHKAPVIKKEFISDSWLLQVDQFCVGDWFTFSQEKETFEPLNLIWIGEDPPVYVFVNRDGYKKQELNPKELAERLENGMVTKIGNLDEPLIVRATTVVLQHMQEKLTHSISHDSVTNLPNRKRFINLLKESLIGIDKTHVLGYLEVEDFRVITNVCGSVGGDQLLLQVAKQITGKLGNDAVVSRIGDKTFGFLIKNSSIVDSQETAKNIRDAINKASFLWDDKSFTISVSIGLVPISKDVPYDVEELLQKADSIIISAIRSGHNTIRVYQENDESLMAQTDIHKWTGRIDRIFSENRLFARCQMIAPIDPEKNSHSHYEILLGVLDENGGIIVPDKFIPAVERCQRMPEIDRWVVEHVFSWIIDNRGCFEKIGGFAINLSGQSLNSEEFLSFLIDRLSLQDIPAERITFEVTETVAAGNIEFTKRFIKEIKQFGCKFSLDDFGTGYSSYAYLKTLNVDYLKIDGSFIKEIAISPTDRVMVNSMNEIARSLGLETIAEYVEDMAIHAVLKEIGVNYAQGYGIHKPMRLVELAGSLLH